ncbi:DUF5008 domain-containing protein [Sphingobacterium suaedae]|uniref:DUF5008 domain-containing protein n=1 Tax=Sphingobacterium suaedae TaxID=1686402 RepID=A0ABW5KNC9_9SPHI
MKRALYSISTFCIGLLILSLPFASCNKEVLLGDDPYGGGREPFGIAFTKNYAYPERAEPGSSVTFYVKGLKAYEGKFEFSISETPVEIIATTDSTIEVLLPEQISSGGAVIKMENQFFAGPTIYVEGNVSVDENFDIVNGFNGPVFDMLSQSGGNVVIGPFTDFENEASGTVYRNGIHFVNSLGKSDNTFNFQRGITGIANSIAKQGDKYYIAGSINEYNRREVSNIVKLNANGMLDSTTVDVLNASPERPENGIDTVASFNGGTLGGIGGGTFQSGTVNRIFPVSGNRLIAVGTFFFHKRIDYRFSTRESRREIRTPVRNVMRLKEDGGLDSNYMINNAGANGSIMDAVIQEDEKLILAGVFTSFNGKAANRIVRLNADGSRDESFAVGTGPNGDISSIQYNQHLGKIVVTGMFTSFNGIPANGIVVMDRNGNIDPTFKLREVGEGNIWFAHMLNSGKILVSHSWNLYDGVRRSNLLILEPDGRAEQKYNNMGLFVGRVEKVLETTSSLGNPAILLGGSIFRAEGVNVGNIVKLEIKD